MSYVPPAVPSAADRYVPVQPFADTPQYAKVSKGLIISAVALGVLALGVGFTGVMLQRYGVNLTLGQRVAIYGAATFLGIGSIFCVAGKIFQMSINDTAETKNSYDHEGRRINIVRGDTKLMIAVKEGDRFTVRSYLWWGANPSTPNDDRSYPLLEAVKLPNESPGRPEGHTPITELLLKRGAIPDQKGSFDQTARQAAKGGCIDCINAYVPPRS